jgi:hypothetical protein
LGSLIERQAGDAAQLQHRAQAGQMEVPLDPSFWCLLEVPRGSDVMVVQERKQTPGRDEGLCGKREPGALA